jgi:sugar-specific transcriptional regulator TrmB
MSKQYFRSDSIVGKLNALGFKELDAKVLVALIQSPCDPTNLAKRIKIPRTKVYESIHRLQRDRWIFPVEKRGRQILLRAVGVHDILQRLQIEVSKERERKTSLIDDLDVMLPTLNAEPISAEPKFLMCEQIIGTEGLVDRIGDIITDCEDKVQIMLTSWMPMKNGIIEKLTRFVSNGGSYQAIIEPSLIPAVRDLLEAHELDDRRQIKVLDNMATSVNITDGRSALVLEQDSEKRLKGTLMNEPAMVHAFMASWQHNWDKAEDFKK